MSWARSTQLSLNNLERQNPIYIALGGIEGWESINRTGFNAEINGPQETVWAEGGLYPWPDTAVSAFIASDSTDDENGGIGAEAVFVEYLDANGFEQNTVLATDGQNPVAMPETLRRVNAYGTVGTQDNIGTLYLGHGSFTAGKPDTVLSNVPPGCNLDQQAIYTIPVDKVGLILTGFASVGAVIGATNSALLNFLVREQGSVFRGLNPVFLPTGPAGRDLFIPSKIGPLADVEIRGEFTLGGAAAPVSGGFELLIVPEDQSLDVEVKRGINNDILGIAS